MYVSIDDITLRIIFEVIQQNVIRNKNEDI